LTLTKWPAILRTMRYALPTLAALRSGLFTRRDLLLEALALRHQLGVLSRANRRFHSSDRVFWLCLRRVWPRWREALVLIQPSTVARWHRRGFHGWWSGRSRRRPGRPRIDSDVRALIRRMSTENRLWGAPRIHGELLKLGLSVSERTVSRYLTGRVRGPSQTWRTFLANHVGILTRDVAVVSPELSGNHDVDNDLLPLGWAPTSGTARRLPPHSTPGHGPASSGRDPPMLSAFAIRPNVPAEVRRRLCLAGEHDYSEAIVLRRAGS